MVKFIHVSDIHFGVENYGRIDPKLAIHTRLLDFYKSFNKVIDFAILNSVDFFLFTGDAYKNTLPTPTQQKLLFQSFIRLYKENIPVIMIIGNHDNPISYGKVNSLDIFSQLPIDGFYVFNEPGVYTLNIKDKKIQIIGIPWITKSFIKDNINNNLIDLPIYIKNYIKDKIYYFVNQLDKDSISILAAHLTVDSAIFSGSEASSICVKDPIFSVSDLAIEPFSYVALGHIHKFQNLNESGIPVIYAGSIDRVDFAEYKDDKGFVFVNIDDTKKANFEFIKLDTRKFIKIDVKIDKSSSLSITDQIIQSILKYDIKDSIIKIIYYLDNDSDSYVDLEKIYQFTKDAHYVVSISAIKPFGVKLKRSSISNNMNFNDVINSYFNNLLKLRDDKFDIIEKIKNLIDENSDI